jgi:preprotein translocase subunit SecG
MTALQNLFANRATLPILVASTLVLAFLFRICALVLVQHVARIDRRRKKLMYRMPLTPVPNNAGQNHVVRPFKNSGFKRIRE